MTENDCVELLDLPSEVLEKILNYLPLKDLKKITLCCHYLNKLVSESTLIRKFTLILPQNHKDDFIPNRKYRKIKFTSNQIYSDEILMKLNVEKIEKIFLIESIFTKNLVEFLENCTQLEFIKIIKPQHVYYNRHYELTKLKSLKLSNCNIPLIPLFKNCPIEEIVCYHDGVQIAESSSAAFWKLRVHKSFDYSGIEKVLEDNKETLQQLEIISLYENLSFDFITQRLKNLIILKFYAIKTPDETMVISNNPNPTLEELTIQVQSPVNEINWLCNILKYYSSIKKLNLPFQFKVDETQAREVCNPKLKFLHVSSVDNDFLTFSRFDNLNTLHIDTFLKEAEIAIIQSVKVVYINYSEGNVHEIAVHFPSMEFLQIRHGNGNWNLSKKTLKRALMLAKQLKILEISKHLCSFEERKFHQVEITFILV